MAKIFLIASGKGGTGKSTCSAFLAEAAALSGLSVLVIELDAGLRVLDLLLDVGEIVYDLGDILTGACEPAQAIIPSKRTPNLSMISAPFNSEMRYDRDVLILLCRWLGKRYDVIILDGGAGIGHNVRCGLAAADHVLVVTNPDIVSVRHAGTFAAIARQLSPAPLRMIINRLPPGFPGKKNPQLPHLDAVIDLVAVQLIGVIPISDEIRRASAAGTALLPDTPIAQIFSRIASRMIGRYVPLYIKTPKFKAN